jgi:hypothetical protein
LRSQPPSPNASYATKYTLLQREEKCLW